MARMWLEAAAWGVGLLVVVEAALLLQGNNLDGSAAAALRGKNSAPGAAANLVGYVGAGIYEAREASVVRAENTTLHQQQTALTQQLQQAQKQRDETSNSLAALKEQIASAKPAQSSSEMLKLRGQVGAKRQIALVPEGELHQMEIERRTAAQTMRPRQLGMPVV